jgi:ABC-type polysaccharide/polyol phosphate export permease
MAVTCMCLWASIVALLRVMLISSLVSGRVMAFQSATYSYTMQATAGPIVLRATSTTTLRMLTVSVPYSYLRVTVTVPVTVTLLNRVYQVVFISYRSKFSLKIPTCIL